MHVNEFFHMSVNELVQDAADNGWYLLLFLFVYLVAMVVGACSWLLIGVCENMIYDVLEFWDFGRIENVLTAKDWKLIEEKRWFKDVKGNYHGFIYHVSKSDYYILRKETTGRSVYYLYDNETLIKGLIHISDLCCLLKTIPWEDNIRVMSITNSYDSTYGKDYLALDETDLCYEIKTDKGKKELKFKNLFIKQSHK